MVGEGLIDCRIEIEQESSGLHDRGPNGECPDGPFNIAQTPRTIVNYNASSPESVGNFAAQRAI